MGLKEVLAAQLEEKKGARREKHNALMDFQDQLEALNRECTELHTAIEALEKLVSPEPEPEPAKSTEVIDAEPPVISREQIPVGLAAETFTSEAVETVKYNGWTHIVQDAAPTVSEPEPMQETLSDDKPDQSRFWPWGPKREVAEVD